VDQEENNDVSRGPKVARSGAPWKFRLYVNGKNSLKSIITQQNLTDFCEKYLSGRCDVEVIDMVENFEMARADRIMALPTLVRREPLPVCKIIGDLSNTNQVVTALGLHGGEAGD
jgi:circadian clock protein KaiB